MKKVPKKRSDCIYNSRPCCWVRCRHHMIWAITGIEKRTDDEICDLIFSLSETCVLDVADKGGATLEEIGQILGITRERVRQIEETKSGTGRKGAIQRLRHPQKRKYLVDFIT